MNIMVGAGNAESLLAFGANPAARDGFDNAFDVPAVFQENAALKASLMMSSGRFWRDIRAVCSSSQCMKFWEVEIESPESPVQITWNPLQVSGKDIHLMDMHTGDRIDMNRRQNYIYVDAKRLLKIEVREEGGRMSV